MNRLHNHHTSMLLVLAALLCAGCHTPVDVALVDEPALHVITERFEEIVAEAHADPEVTWHNGWFGNILVNSRGQHHFGLCYHWQEWVYAEVLPTVIDVGWEAIGVVINEDTKHEHHAVVVYDPERVDRYDLLHAPLDTPRYVLDAWRRGRPDVYHLDAWVEIPLKIAVAPALEELPMYDLPFAELGEF